MGTIADRVQRILDDKGWSQSRLSREADLTRSHIGWILRHPESPVETDTLRKIAGGAKVSLSWLTTGEGTPDSADPDVPLHTDAVEPIAENIPNYMAVEAIDRAAHPDMEEEHWITARGAARYVVKVAAMPGDAYELAKVARGYADPERVARVFAAQAALIKSMEGEREQERLRYERELADLRAQRAGGGKPRGGRKPKG